MLRHKHLMLSLDTAYSPKDEQDMDSLMIQMSKRIDMEIAEVVPPYKNPMSYYCGIAGNEGATGLLLLVTSNIAIHAWNGEYPNRIQVDCYSCKDFDIEDVLLCFAAFKILSGTYILVDRDTKLKVIAEGEIGEGGVILPANADV